MCHLGIHDFFCGRGVFVYNNNLAQILVCSKSFFFAWAISSVKLDMYSFETLLYFALFSTPRRTWPWHLREITKGVFVQHKHVLSLMEDLRVGYKECSIFSLHAPHACVA